LKTNHRAGNFRILHSHIISSTMRKEITGSGNEIVCVTEWTNRLRMPYKEDGGELMKTTESKMTQKAEKITAMIDEIA